MKINQFVHVFALKKKTSQKNMLRKSGACKLCKFKKSKTIISHIHVVRKVKNIAAETVRQL
jgi:ferredoxin-fold anticodon binding domain-containing protein